MGPLAIQILLALLGLAMLFMAGVVYCGTLWSLVQRGGRVVVAHFSLPDLLTSSTLATFFVALMAQSLFGRAEPAHEMSADQVLPSALFLGVIVFGIAMYLHFRGVPLAQMLGLRAQPPGALLPWAVVFLIAAFPLVGLTNKLTQLMLRDMATAQPLVELFRRSSGAQRYSAMAKVCAAAVIAAPVCEEFLFRGYFYGVGKRYIGSLASALCTSLLFAAFHLNLASLPGLFVLALCFTAAYERTGSLLVPIGMHALYNLSSLAIILASSHARLAAP